MTQTGEDIKITGEFLPDPMVCRFNLEEPVLADWTVVFEGREQAEGSALAEALFDVAGVCSVRVSGASITIGKEVPTPWPELARQIVPAIRGALSGDRPAVSEAALEKVRNAPVGDIGGLVERLFEDHINPAIASHGGWVRLIKVEGRDVHLEMGGGCQGCAASRQTLRFGIERAIREVAPQVRNVVDGTDHGAGESPYYG